MALRYFKPVTPSQRAHIGYVDEKITKTVPLPKALLRGKSSTGGRNNQGRMTVRRRGGGHKRRLRLIDFRYRSADTEATLIAFHYDPQRGTSLALLEDSTGTLSYTPAVKGTKVGDSIYTAPRSTTSSVSSILPQSLGNRRPLWAVPTGSQVSGVERKAGFGAVLGRSPGTSLTLLGKTAQGALLRLPSGEVRLLPLESFATRGVLAGGERSLIKIGKAGRSRWRGIRPHVRGSAMNPVDHPHGGGEGKTGPGRLSVSPWGRLTKGKPTVTKRHPSITKRRR